MRRFDGRTIVLTGVGREGQVGEVVARAFAEEGATLVLVAHRLDDARARAATLRAAGHTAHAEACDLADPDQVSSLARTVAGRHGGRIDALVNIAGGFAMSGPVADSDVAVWRRQLDINLTTAYLATRAFLPMLRPAQGAIVYFAAAAALPGARVAEMSAYTVAKSGVVVLMRAVAEEERDAGVRANAIAPTAIRTAANIETMSGKTRYVEREDVARAALFLCSDDARAVTGQILRLA
jgi:NAD(P)-dependent dehydrogenase (short-subunit alcohol dehydrogenase family)